MGRALIILQSDADRQRACEWIRKAPRETRVEFRASKRTLPQNDRMWAMLTDIAAQRSYHGVKLSADDWKILFMDALDREVRAVPSLDGKHFINLGRSSSKLTKEEMSDLQEIIAEWCAKNGVKLREPEAA